MNPLGELTEKGSVTYAAYNPETNQYVLGVQLPDETQRTFTEPWEIVRDLLLHEGPVLYRFSKVFGVPCPEPQGTRTETVLSYLRKMKNVPLREIPDVLGFRREIHWQLDTFLLRSPKH